MPVPPEPPLRFAMDSITFLWNYHCRGDAAAAGAKALRAVAPKSVEKNIVRISIEPNFEKKVPSGITVLTPGTVLSC